MFDGLVQYKEKVMFKIGVRGGLLQRSATSLYSKGNAITAVLWGMV